ncbi:MAG: hypothetical protein ACOYJB_00385 [Christensenellaceae bacterium]|jgi:hypothetical protein
MFPFFGITSLCMGIHYLKTIKKIKQSGSIYTATVIRHPKAAKRTTHELPRFLWFSITIDGQEREVASYTLRSFRYKEGQVHTVYYSDAFPETVVAENSSLGYFYLPIVVGAVFLAVSAIRIFASIL